MPLTLIDQKYPETRTGFGSITIKPRQLIVEKFKFLNFSTINHFNQARKTGCGRGYSQVSEEDIHQFINRGNHVAVAGMRKRDRARALTGGAWRDATRHRLAGKHKQPGGGAFFQAIALEVAGHFGKLERLVSRAAFQSGFVLDDFAFEFLPRIVEFDVGGGEASQQDGKTVGAGGFGKSDFIAGVFVLGLCFDEAG